jgi:hypothetical protein
MLLECSQCHGDKAWKPAHFDHKLLAPAVLDRCESCHNAPNDRTHRQTQGGCKSCHKTDAWKPATFDHDKYFVLDRDHQTSCETCHKNNDYSRYTCYGCHEHSEAKVRAEHLEEASATSRTASSATAIRVWSRRKPEDASTADASEIDLLPALSLNKGTAGPDPSETST